MPTPTLLFLLLPTASCFIVAPLATTVKPPAHVAQVPRHVAPVAHLDKQAIMRGTATLVACVALLGSPHAAMAKGGGHSSSHSSSSHSSSSHSSSSHSSSSHSSSPHSSASRSSASRSTPSRSGVSRRSSAVPRSYSPSRTRSTSRSRRSSRSRSASPFPEEEIHVEYTPPPRPRRTVVHTQPRSSSTVYYDTAPVQPAVVVTPQSATDEAFRNGLWSGRVEAATIIGGAYYMYQQREEIDERDSYERELADTRNLLIELQQEHEGTDPLVAAIQTPLSGSYVGTSAEDDDGDQSVATHLTFGKDGRVSGWGIDGVDGAYVIEEGRWATRAAKLGGGRVAWIEKYDDGFEVALRGQIRDDGVIRALWASDRGVAGSVELARDASAD